MSKLWSALKGLVNNAVEEVEDKNAILILDQELREAREQLTKGSQAMTKISAKRKLTENKIKALKADVEKYETNAVQHAESDRELAIDCANRAGELATQLSAEESMLTGYAKSESTIKANLVKAKNNIKRMEQQIDQVKATAAVQKAQAASSTHFNGNNNKVKSALDSLDRIKLKQAEKAAELEAAEEQAESESGADLEARLNKAGGSGKTGEDALAALLAKK